MYSDCVNLYSDTALWNDENCGASNHFICEKFLSSSSVTVPPTLPQQGYCPGGFTEYGNNCYLSSKEVCFIFEEFRFFGFWCVIVVLFIYQSKYSILEVVLLKHKKVLRIKLKFKRYTYVQKMSLIRTKLIVLKHFRIFL